MGSQSGKQSFTDASSQYQSPSRRPSLSASTNGGSIHYVPPPNPQRSNTHRSHTTRGSGRSGARPTLYPSESASTLVGSALERKVRDDDPISERQDTGSRLEALRDLMRTQQLDY